MLRLAKDVTLQEFEDGLSGWFERCRSEDEGTWPQLMEENGRGVLEVEEFVER